MAHGLILGMTESGKTTLGKWLAAKYKAMGRRILVLDPLLDSGWHADYITSNQEEFLQVLFNPQTLGCCAFIDEGGLTVGRYNTAMQVTATLSRHWGHSCTYLAQEATQLAPIIRAQSSFVYAFCMAKRHGKLLAEEFNAPALERCSELKRFRYISASRFGQVFTNNEEWKNGQNFDAGGRWIGGNRRVSESRGSQESGGSDGGNSGDSSRSDGGSSGGESGRGG